jgi:hypothetical protein
MQEIVRAGLAITAVLAIGAGFAHAAPPKNAPGGPPCHYKQVCVTKNRVCSPAVPHGRPPGSQGTVPCKPGPYQVCTKQRVCSDL